jgi:RNA polymerase sigma factor (sigma-70 family)
MGKDYRINIKVRNNRLIEAIEESGGQLGAKWCKAHNLCYTRVNDLIRLKDSPLQKNQIDLTKTAYRLCEILNKSPNELWSDEQISPLQMNDVSVKLTGDSMKQLVSYTETRPDSLLALTEIKERVQEVMEELTAREQKLLRMRYYDNMTLEESAKEFNVSTERIRQIEAKTFRKLRHPTRLGGDTRDLLGELS